MSAVMELSLCIGIKKTRFDLFDEIKLKLSTGTEISGCIIKMEEWGIVIEQKNGEEISINVRDIEDYIN